MYFEMYFKKLKNEKIKINYIKIKLMVQSKIVNRRLYEQSGFFSQIDFLHKFRNYLLN
jgi:hypothetical protein